jgi:hypothetical protein
MVRAGRRVEAVGRVVRGVAVVLEVEGGEGWEQVGREEKVMVMVMGMEQVVLG